MDISVAAARAAGLRYVSDQQPGIRRVVAEGSFSYRNPDGTPVRDEAQLARIRSLAIPPAYTEVWICARADGHIQATGRDARGRKQYRYHPDWRAVRDANKYDRLIEFAEALPALRARLAADAARPGLPREKVLAAIVQLLEMTLIRVGNQEYAKANRSFGLTTLRRRHVSVAGAELRFHFMGKGGKTWKLKLQDRRIARIVRSCQELPGQALFQYRDADGTLQSIESADVNDYLREITGREVTAKDFRTWSGTVLCALELLNLAPAEGKGATKRNIREAVSRTAARLGNTPTICRTCYVHPEVLGAYQEGELRLRMGEESADAAALRPEEQAVLRFLRRRRAAARQAPPRVRRVPRAERQGALAAV